MLALLKNCGGERLSIAHLGAIRELHFPNQRGHHPQGDFARQNLLAGGIPGVICRVIRDEIHGDERAVIQRARAGIQAFLAADYKAAQPISALQLCLPQLLAIDHHGLFGELRLSSGVIRSGGVKDAPFGALALIEHKGALIWLLLPRANPPAERLAIGIPAQADGLSIQTPTPPPRCSKSNVHTRKH